MWAVLRADRLAGLEALAETLLQDAEHGRDAGLVAFDCVQVAESHGFLRVWASPGPCSEARDAVSVTRGSRPLSSVRQQAPSTSQIDDAIAAPFVSRVMEIEKDWIDYNGHLNMAYYNVIFDRCSDEAFELHGHGPGLCARPQAHHLHGRSPCLLRAELHLGDKVTVTFHLIDHDDKRLRAYQEIRHADGWLAATSETLSLHIDMSGPKVAPFPPDIDGKVEAMRAAHAGLPMPERAGRSIGIKRKS